MEIFTDFRDDYIRTKEEETKIPTLSWTEMQRTPRNAKDTNSGCHFIPHRKSDAASYTKKEQEGPWWTEARIEGKRIFCLVKLNDWCTTQWGRFGVFRQAQLIFIRTNNAALLCTRHNLPQLPSPTFHTPQLSPPRCHQHKQALKKARPFAGKLWNNMSTDLYLWGRMVTRHTRDLCQLQ